MRQTRRTPPSRTRGPAGQLPGLLASAAAPGHASEAARVEGVPSPPAPTAARCRIIRKGRNASGQPLYCHAAADIGDPLAPLRRDPATDGIFSDFDGTLSPIADDPELVEPVAGVPRLLAELARCYAVVAVQRVMMTLLGVQIDIQ
jgi:hypothetical protein